ncbi:MAG: sugar-binding transcriptional regulator [Saccharospirillum sp.]|nr:sugar-binding transcriptional regulator [Saccharospirillum sp.]
MTKTGLSSIDHDHAIRAAWLHFIAGRTQSEVADELGISRAKAHRLIAAAMKSGYVKISISGNVAECVALEQRLCERFKLSYCKLVPDLKEEGSPFLALGVGGAMYLQALLEQKSAKLIGIGHGRTLMAAVKAMPPVNVDDVQFISLLGGLTQRFMANPHDVVHRLAEQLNAEAYVLPVPFLANSERDRDVLLAQQGVAEVFELIKQADVSLVGIGSVNEDAQLIRSRLLSQEELINVKASGAIGELLGHFYDRSGRLIETPFSRRIVAPSIESLKTRNIIAIAGGAEKVDAMGAVLNARVLNGLITDELSASALLGG